MCYNGFVNHIRFLRLPAERGCPANHALPPCFTCNSFSTIVSPQIALPSKANSANFHSPYTLPSSASCKSFVCHFYENCRVCTNNSHSETRHSTPSSFLSHSCALF